MKLSHSILLVLLLGSCSMFEQDEVERWPLTALSIQEIELHQNKITFDVLVEVTSSGWRLASPRTEFKNQEYSVQFMGFAPEGLSLTVMSSLRASITLNVTPGSTYAFKFFRLNGAPLDTTITIPN
jgi:hypothetical protein